MSLRRGFRGEAEAIAEDMRRELGIRNIDQLSPLRMLKALKVPAIPLTQLAPDSSDPSLQGAVHLLQNEEHGTLSAFTVFRGTERAIIYNDAHTLERQASDLCHEAAHGLLLHKPVPAIDSLGCRAWNSDIEDEAQFLAGTLLIPGKGARYAAKSGWSLQNMAHHFGCSIEMARWRYNVAGGRRIPRRS